MAKRKELKEEIQKQALKALKNFAFHDQIIEGFIDAAVEAKTKINKFPIVHGDM